MTDILRRSASRNAAILFSGAALVLTLAVYFFEQPLALSGFGIASLANASLALVLVAMGQTVVLLAGGLDLSVGAIVGLVDCLVADTMGDGVAGVALAVVVALLVGTLAGALNGVLIARGRLEPLIATFGSGFVYGGIALTLRPQPGGHVSDGFAQALTGELGPVPDAAILFAAVLALFWIPVFRSRLGRRITAVGDSDAAAFASGIPVARVRVATYALSGLFAACAALFLAAETTSGDAGIGAIYTLNSLAAAVLGGVSLSGGRGRVLGVVVGAVLLSVIIDLLGVLGVPAFWQDLIEGVLLATVLAAAGLQRRRHGSWIDLSRGGT